MGRTEKRSTLKNRKAASGSRARGGSAASATSALWTAFLLMVGFGLVMCALFVWLSSISDGGDAAAGEM